MQSSANHSSNHDNFGSNVLLYVEYVHEPGEIQNQSHRIEHSGPDEIITFKSIPVKKQLICLDFQQAPSCGYSLNIFYLICIPQNY